MSTIAQSEKVSETPVRAAVVIVWIIAISAAIGSALEVFVTIAGRVVLAFNGADPRLPLTSLPQINQAELREGAIGYLVDAPVWLRVLCATPAMLFILIVIAAAVLISRALHRIADGQPFSSIVRRSIAALSFILIGGGLLYGLLDTLAGGAIFSVASSFTEGVQFPLGADYVVTSTNIPRWPFFMISSGVVGIALSKAFKAGARLEEEADGVV